MTRSFVRAGFWAGLIMLALVIVFGIVAAGTIAGGSLPADAPEAQVRAYFAHAALAPLTLWQFGGAIAGSLFTAAIVESMRDTKGAPWARLGFALFAALSAVFVVVASLVPVLVDAALANAPIMGTYRLWDVAYNSGADALEGGAVLFFGIALVTSGRAGVAGWLGVAAGVAHVPLVLEGTLHLPAIVRLLGMLVFVAWAIATLVWLRRASVNDRPGDTTSEAPAA